MKKMTTLCIVALGLLAVAVLLYRERHRAPAPLPGRDTPPRPENDWQRSLKVDSRTDYTRAESATTPIPERLREEERRQRPEEGRN